MNKIEKQYMVLGQWGEKESTKIYGMMQNLHIHRLRGRYSKMTVNQLHVLYKFASLLESNSFINLKKAWRISDNLRVPNYISQTLYNIVSNNLS